MDFNLIGKRIQDMRINLSMSQIELSEGICSQAQISKIEQGKVYPLANTLFLISKKLGVDCNYFFNIGTTPNIDYINKISKIFWDLRRQYKYAELYELVLKEEKKPLLGMSVQSKQLLLWNKAVCVFELHNNIEEASELLEKAILLQEEEIAWTEYFPYILMTKGILLMAAKKYDESFYL